MDLIVAFAVALLVSTLVIPLSMRYALQLGLLDAPGEDRKVHSTPIPRCGGIGIAAGVLFAGFLWLPLNTDCLMLGLACIVIIAFGLFDDRYNLSFQWKFIGQVAAALIAMIGGVLIERVPFLGFEVMPLWLSLPLTLVFIVGVTNAVNLSDGLDGLAGGKSLLSLGFVAFLGLRTDNTVVAILGLAGVGGLLGFLRFNTHPAKVFMGDTGSQFLGFLTVCLAILVTQAEQSAYSPLLPLLIIGLPILDTFMVMGIRGLEGRHLFSPDRNHIHHQLLALNFRHYEVVAILYLLCTGLIGIAWLFRFSSDALLLALYLLYSAALLAALYWARVRQWQFRSPEESDRERRRSWTRQISWYHHHSPKVLEAGLGTFFLIAALNLQSLYGMGTGLAVATVVLLSSLTLVVLRDRVSVATRLVFYISLSFLLFAFSHSLHEKPLFNSVMDIYLGILALLLLLAIRVTRKSDFRFDTQDYLVLLVILIAPQFLSFLMPEGDLTRLALRFAVLAFVAEFLLARQGNGNRPLRLCCLGSLLLLGSAGFTL